MSILECILNKYPDIEGVTYWETKYDGTPWDDPYDGLVWENKSIKKPTKKELNLWATQANIDLQKTINNSEIYLQLIEIDRKSIRALRTNDTDRLQALEQEAVILRTKLIKG